MQSQREAQRRAKQRPRRPVGMTGSREILHTWFAGYFPAEEPEYAIVVLKEDGSSGATDGAPVFKEIAQGINQMKAQER